MPWKCNCCGCPAESWLCRRCEEEASFIARFERGDSIERTADSWAIGLMCVGLLLAGVAAFRWAVQSGIFTT